MKKRTARKKKKKKIDGKGKKEKKKTNFLFEEQSDFVLVNLWCTLR